MPRQIYVSCASAFMEQQLERVEHLCQLVQSVGYDVQFPPHPWPGYPVIERLIEQCDAFVAVVGQGYKCSTWLNHELHYAWALHKSRPVSKPRLFSLQMAGYNLPHCSEHIPIEWLSTENHNSLLAALLVIPIGWDQ